MVTPALERPAHGVAESRGVSSVSSETSRIHAYSLNRTQPRASTCPTGRGAANAPRHTEEPQSDSISNKKYQFKHNSKHVLDVRRMAAIIFENIMRGRVWAEG
jgi:hypothetical protein